MGERSCPTVLSRTRACSWCSCRGVISVPGSGGVLPGSIARHASVHSSFLGLGRVREFAPTALSMGFGRKCPRCQLVLARLVKRHSMKPVMYQSSASHRHACRGQDVGHPGVAVWQRQTLCCAVAVIFLLALCQMWRRECVRMQPAAECVITARTQSLQRNMP